MRLNISSDLPQKHASERFLGQRATYIHIAALVPLEKKTQREIKMKAGIEKWSKKKLPFDHD